MRVQDMTKAGKVQFHGDLCDRGLRVRKWSYRLNGRHWIEGSQNNFRIESVSGNEYSWSLQVRMRLPPFLCFPGLNDDRQIDQSYD